MNDNKKFKLNDLEIRSNYDDKWVNNSIINHKDFIWIHGSDNDTISLSLKQAEFIVNSLQELINYIKSNTPQINDKVKIINHIKFEGFEGTITDIDTCDTTRPIAIKVIDADISGTVYVGYNQIEKINN